MLHIQEIFELVYLFVLEIVFWSAQGDWSLWVCVK